MDSADGVKLFPQRRAYRRNILISCGRWWRRTLKQIKAKYENFPFLLLVSIRTPSWSTLRQMRLISQISRQWILRDGNESHRKGAYSFGGVHYTLCSFLPLRSWNFLEGCTFLCVVFRGLVFFSKTYCGSAEIIAHILWILMWCCSLITSRRHTFRKWKNGTSVETMPKIPT